MEIVEHGGAECVVMNIGEYEDLIDARDHAIAMRGIAAGVSSLTQDEVRDFVSAPSPLAFWRKKAGKSQTDLARHVGISQPFMAQLESGKRNGTVGVLSKLAKALRVRIEDLVDD